MKNILLCFTFLSMALLCHAQKTFKNEVSLGYFNAGEFFDTSAFNISTFTRGKNISINYTRLFGKNLTVGLTYARCYFRYLPTPTPEILQPNSIGSRYQKTLTANIGYEFSKWSLSARAKAGLRYNLKGLKSEHYSQTPASWGWESRGGIDEYGKIGVSLGVSIQHPIIWRFFGELDCEYAKMFSGADRNQLLLSYRIGFKF